MNREDIVKIIEESKLNDEKKRELLNLIMDKGLTKEVVDKVKESLDDFIVDTLKEAGEDITEKEEYKAAQAEFAQEADAAKTELDAEMAEINTEMKKVEEETAQQLDELQADAIKSQIE